MSRLAQTIVAVCLLGCWVAVGLLIAGHHPGAPGWVAYGSASLAVVAITVAGLLGD